MMFSALKTNTSSEDAKTFAPCSCAAESEKNTGVFAGIAVAMSVFCICIINVINICAIIIGIIILNIIMGTKFEKAKC